MQLSKAAEKKQADDGVSYAQGIGSGGGGKKRKIRMQEKSPSWRMPLKSTRPWQ